MDFGDGPRYELAEDTITNLFICEGCGSVAEFEECPLDPGLLPATLVMTSLGLMAVFGH